MKDYLIKIKDVEIAWTNKGTFKNLEKTINDLHMNQELIQVENSISHMHIIIKEHTKKTKQFKYKVYEEPISFSVKGTYNNLANVVNKIPDDEEFFQIVTTPTHLHLITRKPK